jgi:Flp pilus assembly protein TadD
MDESDAGLLAQAIGALERGETAEASALFKAFVADNPGHALAHHQLGVLALAQGDAARGVEHLGVAASLVPLDPAVHNNLGVALKSAGRGHAARVSFETAVSLDPEFAAAWNNLGAAVEAEGDVLGAIGAYRRALAVDPANVEARENLDLACAKAAPAWHFPMMADRPRNAAYAAALARAAPGRRVLDIGSGSGLLAMMAARAGASVVDSCETVAPIAETARRIVTANGLDGRVRVHAKHSGQLVVGEDLADRAQVLVTETFASGVLSEAVLPTLEHARRHLLVPDAQIIPRGAQALGYLVGGEAIEAHFRAPGDEGFDLSGFEVFAPAKVGLHLDRLPHEALSDDFEIFAFDLTGPSFAPQRRAIAVRATVAGRCLGVAQWLRLDMDGVSAYENRPHGAAAANGWMHVLYRFERPVQVQPGQVVRLEAGHNRTAMTIGLALEQPPAVSADKYP